MLIPREKFQTLLKKLFQFDRAELDFGIYRIMNQKQAVIERFIEKDLLDGVEKELTADALAQMAGLAQELIEVATQIKQNFGKDALDAEENLAEQYHKTPLGTQYLELKSKASGAKSSTELEALIFNHLYTFFSRYYDEGDFMSLRRYSKRDKYAIPYNGEEVFLHWANSDQYYIKTGENFTDYSYKHGGWIVHFKLRNANVEQNNVKGAKRFFIPRAADAALDEKSCTLTIPFEYRPLNTDEEIRYGKGNGEEENGNGKVKAKKKKGQDGILADAIAVIQQTAKKTADALAALLHEKRKDADGNSVSLLDHHLRVYTRKNTSDFFIHKDLKGFLERELDFYLKNEVLNLDELEAGGEARAESWFQTLRTIKGIGRRIIAFVAQIENFQKRLFEKRKFVTEVHYCVTLDQVPEELYAEIAKNKAQIEEWKRLFHIHGIERDTTQPGYSEPLKIEFLKAHRFMVIDTRNFPKSFKDKLEAKLEHLEENIDGILIKSENWQAVRFLQAQYKESIDAIYLDPPYNTAASEIIYKNSYKHSSWLTLLEERLIKSKELLQKGAICCIAIDDAEQARLKLLLDKIFGAENFLANVVIRSKPQGRAVPSGFSPNHDYALFYSVSSASEVGRLPRTEEKAARYPERDEDGIFTWANFRGTGANSTRDARKKLYYPVYVKSGKIRVPRMNWKIATEEWEILEKPHKAEVVVWPIDEDGVERVWTLGEERARDDLRELDAREVGGRMQIYRKYRPHQEGALPGTWWDDPSYSASESGTKLLQNIFGTEKEFDYPKSLYTVLDCLRVSGAATKQRSVVLDFFAGSGTTGHAVIELNRSDSAHRKYILADVGSHFNTVLVPRLKKIIYAKDWKNGKPVTRRTGISHCLKIIQIESYEDALDNITFQAADEQAMLQLEDYVLSYVLDFETKESETLLNVAKLDAPFDYKLRRHGQDEPLPVDLPETFNYLIGLHVKSRQVYDNKGTRYLVYRGLAEGRETVILWRTITGWGKKEFEADREFVKQHDLTKGAEDIFINTDSFIPDARSLDSVFKRLMFSEG